jgi:hypothetical protein
MTDWKPVLSYGGGVNSTALAILAVNEGWRGHIVFSDTGTEWPDTYCFMDLFERDWLAPRGLHIERLGAEWRIRSKKMSVIDHCYHYRIVPIIRFRWCTAGYKREPFGKWCKAHGFDQEADAMIGIAADESWRMMSACRPLVDRVIDRDGCVRIIQAEGLPVPRKSGCYICPFQPEAQWRELWTRYPELYARAEGLEQQAQEKCARKGDSGMLDPHSRWTLAQRRVNYEKQIAMPEIDMDELMEYRPCMCSL